MATSVPGIFDKFKLYAETTGASFMDADETPMLESTARDYPGVRMMIRGRNQKALTGPANGFVSKFKLETTGNYGPREPLTPVEWTRGGSYENWSSNYCHEWGSMTIAKQEVEFNAGGVWDAKAMRQKFDDVLRNNKQDMYVDIAEKLEASFWATPTPAMEDPSGNVPRSLFGGMNEFRQGHGVHADGCFPGITRIQNYDVAKATAGQLSTTIEHYDAINKQDGSEGRHLFQAFARGFRNVKFKAVPLAENLTQGTEGQREVWTSLEGTLLLDRVLNAHDNVTAVEGPGNALQIRTRFAGAEIQDIQGMEDFAVCASYEAGGITPSTAANGLYDPGAREQAYYTEKTSPNAVGPRFYVPYQPHICPIFAPDGFLSESPMYALDQTIPDALVMSVATYRNMHFKSMRRGLIIRPAGNVVTYS